MKRILSMFLALCMVMTLLPMTALASPEEYGILVDGEQVTTDDKDGSDAGAYDTANHADYSYVKVASESVSVDSVTGAGYVYNTGTKELTITSNDGAKGSSEWRNTTIINDVLSIIVGDAVTQVGENAFNSIPKLTSVHLGAGVSSVAPVNFSVFLTCPQLTSIEVHEDNTTYKDVDGVLFSKDGKKLIRYPDGKQAESYEIPNDVETIDYRAFYYNKNIKSVRMQDSVTKISAHAFMKCSNLTEVNLEDSVTEIGSQAFDGCSNLTTINLPSDMTTVGGQAFSGCSKLESIRIPEGVTSLGGLLFVSCNNLKHVFMDPLEAPVIVPFTSKRNLFSDSMNSYIYIPIGATGYTAENYWPVDKVIEGRAALSALTLVSETLSPAFSPNVTNYTVAVPNSADQITITPTIGLGTGLAVNGLPSLSGQNTLISLNAEGDTNISIVVTNDEYPAEAKTYIIEVISAGDLSVSLTPGNGKITLAPQTTEPGYKYYYKTTSADDSLAKPGYGSVVFNSAGWTSYDAETDITSAGADEIFVQVVRVRDADSKIYGWGQESAAPLTYTISGTITGSDTLSGIAATVQLKNSSNENVGSPVVAGVDGSYTIINVPAASGYTIEVSCTGYNSGTIASFDVTAENITGKDLTLVKTVVFKPVTEISGVATTGIVGTDVILSGVVTPADATNKTIVWSLGEGSTAANAMVSDDKASATGAGTVVAKATINNGATASTDYIQEFVITFSEVTPIIYTVTFNTNGGTRTGGGELTQNVAYGESVVAPILTRYGYTFNGWDKPLTNITTAQTITAQWTATSTGGNDDGNDSGTGGGSDGGNGSGSGSTGNSGSTATIIVTPPAPEKPDAPTQAEIKVPVTVDDNNNALLNITNQIVTEAFEKALAAAKEKGNEENGIALVLSVDTGNKATDTVTVNLPKTVQDAIISKRIVSTIVVVDNPNIRINMDLATVEEINSQANSDVNVKATKGDNSQLSEEAREAIGNRPVFDMRVNFGSGRQVQNFGDGRVTVAIPYTLGPNEKADNICAVYIDGDGRVHWLTDSVYDREEQVLRFSTNHFSLYGVGYKEEIIKEFPAFTDIDNHWAKEDIEFAVRQGLFSGASETSFSPNMAMTRGMFVTVLGRLAKADISGYRESSFTDVKDDAYYIGYIELARENNIVNGISNERFAPDQPITREQMAVIMQNYARATGFTLPKVHEESSFTDNKQISAYALEAAKGMQMAGVLNGRNGNFFDPQGTATRADVSAVLRRFMELISSETQIY